MHSESVEVSSSVIQKIKSCKKKVVVLLQLVQVHFVL
ncbi:hypothetical protein CWS_00685 [Buchnera aphidicola str. JF99 (Acyrthosiphon pisum)]|nr:hypothetical protein CWS_00685 [Buchnera aphidicola str. JF99 (Acyrthosiphon pisum)]